MWSLADGLRRVGALLRRRLPFEHIEAEIESMELTADERSVLWLYAWCEGQPRELREIVADYAPTGGAW